MEPENKNNNLEEKMVTPENNSNMNDKVEQEPKADETAKSNNKPVSRDDKGNTSTFELYASVRGVAVKILNRVDNTDAYLDKLLDNELKNSELNGQDKSLLFEIVHGVIRWMGRIDWILNGFYKGQFSKCIPTVKNAMRVALYQILFLDKIPDYAAVNEAVEFIKRIQGQKPGDLTNAVLRSIIRSKNAIRFPDPEEDQVSFMSTYYSHPTWMIKRWLPIYGKEGTEALLSANNERPSLTLRVNTIKTTREQFKELLHSVGLKYYEGRLVHDFLKLRNLTNITDWEYFDKGYFTIQDESTGLPCILLGVKPGMRVLDLCAAPGGKTSYLSNLMKNEGEIIALDKFESRIKIMNKNLERLGITNVKTFEADANTFEDGLFDKVLLDAPCSGLGTLSKKPDIKWKRDTGDIRTLNKIQYDLLTKAATFVKPGGSLVYSTCTIEPEENFGIIKKFLGEHNDFKLFNAKELLPQNVVDENGCVQTLPHVHFVDGSFCARLEKITTTP